MEIAARLNMIIINEMGVHNSVPRRKHTTTSTLRPVGGTMM